MANEYALQFGTPEDAEAFAASGALPAGVTLHRRHHLAPRGDCGVPLGARFRRGLKRNDLPSGALLCPSCFPQGKIEEA